MVVGGSPLRCDSVVIAPDAKDGIVDAAHRIDHSQLHGHLGFVRAVGRLQRRTELVT